MGLIHDFMVRRGPQRHITETDVSVPPALTITDQSGAIWTLGTRTGPAPRGEFAFNVLRNGMETGEFASRIERKGDRVRIFTANGWKQLFISRVDDVTTVYGVGAKVTRALLPSEDVPAAVKIYRDGQLPDALPLVAFSFDPRVGGATADLNRTPIECHAGEWLTARVSPASLVDALEIVAAVGPGTLRALSVSTL